MLNTAEFYGLSTGQARAVIQEIAFCEIAEQAVADLDFALKQSAVLVPQLLNARVKFWTLP